MKIKEVQGRTSLLLMTLINLWEDSVRATHHFLSNQEVEEIKKYVPQALKEVEHLFIAENEWNQIVAFMGIEKNRLEMLFVSPEERKKGIGKFLISHGIEKNGICEVTVNEQNPQAVGFYQHLGFKTYKRTSHDEQGNPYPLLYMKWENYSETESSM